MYFKKIIFTDSLKLELRKRFCATAITEAGG